MPTKPAPLLQPFAGVLPSPDKAHLVATRSYLTYSDYELKDKLSRNPYSYLHVIHPMACWIQAWVAFERLSGRF